MKKVITYGTYDLLHVGHVNLLRRARELGDYLIVVLSTDEFNALKHKTAYHSYEDRKAILEAIRYVDEVIPEYNWEQKISDVQDNDVDIFVMGDDWALITSHFHLFIRLILTYLRSQLTVPCPEKPYLCP